MISFERARWKNVFSTGNAFTEIDFNRSQNTLIVGENGSGKSTLLDVLCLVLFNKPFRKINKPQLVNSINGKDCVGEVEFSVGTKKYKIVRGIKPAIFEIFENGVLVSQDAKTGDYQEYLEKVILKMNYKSFTQVVILGSASFTPFMQLSAADRRAIIEDLLDIQIFTSMNSVVKNKLSILKEAHTKNKYAIELLSEKIAMQKQNIENHKKRNTDDVLKLTEELEKNNAQLEDLYAKTNGMQNKISELQLQVVDKIKVDGNAKKIIQLETKLESNIDRISDDIKFYENNDNCPTCKQELESSFKNEKLTERKHKKSEVELGLIELSKKKELIESRLKEIQEINNAIMGHNNTLIQHNSLISSTNKYVIKIQKEIDALNNQKDTSQEDEDKLNKLNAEFDEIKIEYDQSLLDKQYYEHAITLLKDTGVKTGIVKRDLVLMNKLINKYLTAMNFFANFTLNENFEESIKSRHRDDFSYANFSEGEKMRIDLALLLTWRQIAKNKNSTNTNLLILDEVFDSSLDATGTDEFMKLIHELGKEANVFVISHKGNELFDKFHSVIRFQKKNNFSQVAA